jgi:hypothetical protein
MYLGVLLALCIVSTIVFIIIFVLLSKKINVRFMGI